MRAVSYPSVFLRVPTHDFTHVQNDNGGLEADSETGDQTTGDNHTEGIGTGARDDLNDHTNGVDHTAIDDGPFAANQIGDIAGNQRTEEGAGRQDGDNQGLVRRRQGSRVGPLDHLHEQLGAIHTIDVTRIIPEKDTAETGKGAQEVGLPGNGRLDAVDICCRVEGAHLDWLAGNSRR